MKVSERARVWIALTLLLSVTLYSGCKVVKAHVSPRVKSPGYTFSMKMPARRGTIYDVKGRRLVRSVPYWDYHLDPVAITNTVRKVSESELIERRNEVVKTISQTLGIDRKKVQELAERKKGRYFPLAVSDDAAAFKVMTDPALVSGVRIEIKHVRDYTSKPQMAHVLGFLDSKGKGVAGLEQRLDAFLTGVPGEMSGCKDALGNPLYDRLEVLADPMHGSDVYLTLDATLQFEAEEALAEGVKEFGAGSGWCVVMNAKNGAILAMATLPTFDPVKLGDYPESSRLNRVTGFTYEPGSVMKSITAAAAFDCGFATPSTRYNTNQYDEHYYKLPGDGSHVWDPTMTVADALVHSSNIVIGKLGYDFGPEALYDAFVKFGFGKRTGIELPAEEKGILYNPRKTPWNLATRSRAAIGQAFSVTALQLASAYQAIANDGVRMKPHLVDRIVNAKGETIYQHRHTEVSRPISAKTAATMRKILSDVATPNGTARRAAIRGYSVAGKTGTAQKAGRGGYLPGLYRATFCGMVPAQSPEIVVLVTLDFDQRTTYHQGGNSSAPIFRRIAKAALRYLMIPPDRPEELDEEEDNEINRVMDDRERTYDNLAGN